MLEAGKWLTYGKRTGINVGKWNGEPGFIDHLPDCIAITVILGLASFLVISGPNSERWASEMWPALASFPDPQIPIDIPNYLYQ